MAAVASGAIDREEEVPASNPHSDMPVSLLANGLSVIDIFGLLNRLGIAKSVNWGAYPYSPLPTAEGKSLVGDTHPVVALRIRTASSQIPSDFNATVDARFPHPPKRTSKRADFLRPNNRSKSAA
jgi:hypothetical protein